jgi:serine/threonine-protein kinase
MNAKEPTHGIGGAQPSVNADQPTRAVDPHASHALGVDVPISADLAGAFRATRFRLRELHAHGGLGEVYVADDLELGRPVALKRIRDGREFRAEDEIRFRREAEITGRLEHPGIVPIYGLGSDAENRPFYAMRFIEGQTLASAIDAFHDAERPGRDPGERTLALRHLLTRLVAACQAVAFAHSRGIIHRDIKPANIMLGNFGETLVVDWGLAKPADASPQPGSDGKQAANPQNVGSSADANSTWATSDEVPLGSDPSVATSGSSASATVLGTVLGTPAFMSPEQAKGQWDSVGPKSDIFSLGATLYQLISGRPPYRGDLMLDDAIHCHYLWPRRHNPGAPPELEAIVVKAMARRPEDRYASAQLLAADIEKWLGQEPISVYWEPWTQRVGRRMRRHRTLVTAIGVAILVAVLLMGFGSIWLNEARRNEMAAKKRAQTLAEEASAKYKLARKAVDDMLTGVGEKLRTPQDLPAVRRELLQQALEFNRQFLIEKSDDPEVQRETAGAFGRAASIHRVLGESKQAESEYLESIRLWSSLVDRDGPAEDRNQRGYQRFQLGNLYHDQIRYAEAEKVYLASRDDFAILVKQNPDDWSFRNNYASALHSLARIYSHTGRFTKSEATYREALAMRAALAQADSDTRYLDGLARTQSALADVLRSTAKWPEAEKIMTQAIAGFRELTVKEPGSIDHRLMLASCIDQLGAMYGDSGRFDDSAKTLAEALTLREKLAAEQPLITDAREGIGFTLRKISWLNEMTGNNAEAEKNLRRTLELWEKLAADFPAMPSYRGNVADTLSQLGDVLHNLKRPQDAASAFQRAQAILIDLLKQYPDNNWFRSGLARAYNDEALLEQDAKRWTEAEALLEKSLALRAELVNRLPNDIAAANALGGVYVNLGNLEHGRLQYPKALDWYGKAIDVLGAVFAQKPSDTTTRRFLSAAYWDRARSLAALHYHSESLPDWEKALELAPPENKAAIQLGKGISAVLALSPQNKTKDKSP